MRRCLVLLGCLLLLASPASAQWVRVESANFTVFGEVGEKRTREFAAEFERFREALGRVVAGAAVRPAVPTVVFIFRDQRSLAPHRPLYKGRPVEVGGYFYGSSSLSLIMLDASRREASLRTVYHEYAHLITSNVVRHLPAWLSEGLAEYYSTFEVSPDGRRATLGRLIDSHLVRLNEERLLTLEELLAVERDSPLYNEGSRRSVFYAQSWALVHMLLNGEPRRNRELETYIRLVAAGRPAADAWQEAFAGIRVFDDFRRYITRSVMTGFAFRFDRDIPPSAFTVSAAPRADVEAALGDLRRHVDPESAAGRVAAIADASPYVLAVRGLVKQDAGRDDEALPLLLEAARTSDDWLVLYRAATGLERIATASGAERSAPVTRAALAALDRVVAARPELPHAIALRGLLLGPGDEGLAAIRRARQLAPGHDHYAVWQAQLHVQRGEFVSARQLLGPLLSPLVPGDIREYARAVMGQAAAMELARAAAAERRAITDDPAPPPPAGMLSRGGEVHWVFRELKPGEKRIEGMLERIECLRSGAVVHVRAEGGPVRFSAAKFEAIEFITYRDDLGGSVTCGPRTPPDRVYVTVTPDPAGAGAGRVVAIEFLPPRESAPQPSTTATRSR
ncbi:MAG TPA: DUF1570 domain-containing protein [Vicinamibacterales bacterium]|nr:DUF1570 domain-containing protein [Vicinamibacterales bacterium]